VDTGDRLPDISFKNAEGVSIPLRSYTRHNGLLILFLSSSCPYVNAQKDRLIVLHGMYAEKGIGFLAVYPNTDISLSPRNSREGITAQHREIGYPFDLVYDGDQSVARALGAVCTPDIFLFDGEGALFYHGRLDDSWRDPAAVKRAYLREAIDKLLTGQEADEADLPTFGCAIKWNESAEDLSATPFEMSRFLRRIRHATELQLVHLLSGAVAQVNPDTLEFIKAFREPTTLSRVAQTYALPGDIEETFRRLVDLHYLVPAGSDETDEYRERIKLRRRRISSGALLSILRLNVATGCNLRCTYCYLEKAPVDRAKKTHSTVMPWEIARAAVDAFLDNAASNGRRHVTIRYIGGEPLINRKVLVKTMMHAEAEAGRLGINVAHLLCTNGLLVDREFARFLARIREVHALVSLDGMQEDNDRMRVEPDGTGTHNKIVAAIKLLQEEGVPVSVPAVVSTDNYLRLVGFLEEMAAFGIRQVGLNPEYRFGEGGTSAGSAAEIATTLLACRQAAQRLGITLTGKAFLPEWHVRNGNIANCEAMGRSVVVDPDGSLSVCDKLREKCGTVADLSSVFRFPRYREFAMRVRGNIDVCSNCEARWTCNGGCAAEIVIAGGNEKDTAINCDFIRTMTKGIYESIL
jgi:radical SAM protein with 4Fe4S-binding SPASM domain